MKCKDCGHENWSGTEFCVHCSAALYEKREIK